MESVNINKKLNYLFRKLFYDDVRMMDAYINTNLLNTPSTNLYTDIIYNLKQNEENNPRDRNERHVPIR